MLSIFRHGVTAKIMLVILALGLFAIVITGFGTGGSGLGSLGGLGGSTIATVDGDKIDSSRLRDETERQLTRMREQRPGLEMAAFVRSGALDEVLDQLIGMSALVGFGRDQGLAASKQMIDREIASIPAFQNMAGQFDAAQMARALAQEKISVDQLRKEVEARMIQRQLLLPAAGSAHVPQGLAFQYASLLLESRTGMVGAVPVQAVGIGQEPTDAEVAAFYKRNIARYTIPERRVLRYAVFGRETVAAQSKPTEAEIAAAYKQNAAAYAPTESRTLSQVVLPDEAAARAFAQKVASGTSFAAAAQQAGFGAGDIAIGTQTKEAFAKLSSPAVANAAFAAAKGATTAPVRSEFGWHVVRVDDVKQSAGKPLTAVRAELAAQIEQQKAQNAIADLASRIEAALADGSSFEEIAAKEKLEIKQTPPVTSGGAAPDTPTGQAPAEIQPLLATLFEMLPDEDPSVEPIAPNERYALIQLTRVVPPVARPLAQIAPQVKAELVGRRALERARAVATAVVSKINAGLAPAQAFAQAGVRLPPIQTITATRREIARGQQVPPPLAMMFSLPRGKARLLPAPNNGGWFVVYLDKVTPGDASKEAGLTQAVRSQFAQVLGDEYAQQFTRAVRARAKIKRNDEALRKLKAELLGTPAAQ